MIWVAGEIIPADSLLIPAHDHTFEHGLGLFETFRTWNQRATTLPLQLERLIHSSQALGLPQPLPDDLPDQAAVNELLQANGHSSDRLLRLTMSAGSPRTRPVIWLQDRPLPSATRAGGAKIRASWHIEPNDLLHGHKTLNYWRRRLIFEKAQHEGLDEDLALHGADEAATEGTRTNIFLIRGNTLKTPGAFGGLLPGIMRRLVLDQAGQFPSLEIETSVSALPLDEIANADEVFLTNSVRGMVPVGSCVFGRSGLVRETRLPAPGPITTMLWEQVHLQLLNRGVTHDPRA